MTKRLQINGDVLLSYIEKSGVEFDALVERVKDIDLLVGGEKLPTYNQLEKIANLIHTPVGLLTLNSHVDITMQRLSFRTHNSAAVGKMSPELRDTIVEMQEKQSFLQEQIEEFITLQDDAIKNSSDHMQIAEAIRSKLQLPVDHLSASRGNPVRYFRDAISNIGIFVFFNGKIRDNTRRPLDPKEFRGFSLKSSKAPIIFINQKDSSNAQLFTMIHELAHLFMDDEGISQASEQQDYTNVKTEAIVNRVAAEILVPKVLFERETELDIETLAKKYKVSRYVIARRLLDFDRITQDEYNQAVRLLKSSPRVPMKSGGGNYNTNLRFRVDHTFFRFVHSAIMQDRVSYTEAFRLIGTGYKGFKDLESKLV